MRGQTNLWLNFDLNIERNVSIETKRIQGQKKLLIRKTEAQEMDDDNAGPIMYSFDKESIVKVLDFHHIIVFNLYESVKDCFFRP